MPSAAIYLLLHCALWTAIAIVAGLSVADDRSTPASVSKSLLWMAMAGGMAVWSAWLMEA